MVTGLQFAANHQSPITTHALFLLLALALTAGPVVAGEAEWRMLYEQADVHFQRGDLQQAELFAREALKEAETSLGEKKNMLYPAPLLILEKPMSETRTFIPMRR